MRASMKRAAGYVACLVGFGVLAGCQGSGGNGAGVRNETHVAQATGKYDRLLIAPVAVTFDPGSEHIQADEKEVESLRTYMREAVVKAVKDRYKVVDRPGQGVMRLQVTITDVKKGEPLMHLHWSTKLLGLGLGGATMRSTLSDSVTGEELGFAFISKLGNFFQLTEGQSKWGEAKAVMDEWAKEFRKRLDEQRKQV